MQAQIYRIQEQAWKALEQAGIEAILMKGAGLAALYPEPQMRQWGDVDLFVGKDQYHAAARVMRDTFPDALKFDEELDHYKHYNLIADGVSIEVHRVSVSMSHPMDARRYEKMERYGTDNGEWLMVNGLKVKIFEPTFNVLFVMLHSWEHMLTQGANLRQIYDLRLLVEHYADAIDRRRLGRWLRALRLMDVWQLYMWICVERLGLPEAKAPFVSKAETIQERAERMLETLLTGRMSEPKAETASPSSNRFVRKWHTMKSRMRNADRIAQFSPAYARHMRMGIMLSGLGRLFAKDRHWE